MCEYNKNKNIEGEILQLEKKLNLVTNGAKGFDVPSFSFAFKRAANDVPSIGSAEKSLAKLFIDATTHQIDWKKFTKALSLYKQEQSIKNISINAQHKNMITGLFNTVHTEDYKRLMLCLSVSRRKAFAMEKRARLALAI